MTSSIKHIIFFLLLIAQPIMAFGQSKVIVVTRKLEQKWEAKTGSKIIINGEKARIIIEQSNTNIIEVQLKLKSKHANIDIAKKELQYLKYNLNKKGREIYLNNQILLPSNILQAEGRLEAEYLIKAPVGSDISIENNLGDISLSGLKNNINIDIKYGNISLNNITGSIDVTTSIGDIKGSELSGEGNIKSEYSEIRMENISGDYVLQTRYGSLEVIPGIDLKTINIGAYKTDVSIFNKQCQEYDLDIETHFGSVKLLQTCYVKDESLLDKTIQKEELTDIKYRKSEAIPEIIIKSKFAVINLQ